MKRSRLRDAARRLAGVGGVLAMVLLAVHVFLLPTIAASLIRRRMHDLGFPDAEFTLRGISLSGAQVADVRLDASGDLRIAAVHVVWSIGDLLAGRVHAV